MIPQIPAEASPIHAWTRTPISTWLVSVPIIPVLRTVVYWVPATGTRDPRIACRQSAINNKLTSKLNPT